MKLFAVTILVFLVLATDAKKNSLWDITMSFGDGDGPYSLNWLDTDGQQQQQQQQMVRKDANYPIDGQQQQQQQQLQQQQQQQQQFVRREVDDVELQQQQQQQQQQLSNRFVRREADMVELQQQQQQQQIVRRDVDKVGPMKDIEKPTLKAEKYKAYGIWKKQLPKSKGSDTAPSGGKSKIDDEVQQVDAIDRKYGSKDDGSMFFKMWKNSVKGLKKKGIKPKNDRKFDKYAKHRLSKFAFLSGRPKREVLDDFAEFGESMKNLKPGCSTWEINRQLRNQRKDGGRRNRGRMFGTQTRF